MLSTQAGDVHLRIPKVRQGAFFPVILEPRRRIDQALHAVVMEASETSMALLAPTDPASDTGPVAITSGP